MAKRQGTSLEEMQRAARAHRTTYAELQRRETMDMIPPIGAVPAGYRKAGERRKASEK